MLKLKDKYGKINFFIPVISKRQQYLITEILDDTDLTIIFTEDKQQKLDGFSAANACLAKSGTNTLEISACNTAMIVAYKLNILSWWLIKLALKIDYASLVNIAANQEIIPEYIQHECNTDNLFYGICQILDDTKLAQQQVKSAHQILQDFGLDDKEKPSARAAKIIKNILG